MTDKVFLINFTYDIKTSHVASCLMKGESEEAVREKFTGFAKDLENLQLVEVEDTSSHEFIAKEVEKEEARRREMEQWEQMMNGATPGEQPVEEAEVVNIVDIKNKMN